MKITHVIQPPGTAICGQCCIAMLTNTPIHEITTRFGDSTTTAKKLQEIAREYNIETSGVVYNYKAALRHPPIAILMLRKNKVKTGHWVLKVYDTIYDPQGLIYKYYPGFKIIGYEVKGFIRVTIKTNQ